MNRHHFRILAKVNLPYALQRAQSAKVPQAVIALWIINCRAVVAQSTH